MTTFENANETLNPQQIEAVTTTEGPVMVLAGAGSGKTKVLVHRIANLIKIGNPPNKILAITFTNKAAAEMRQRVRALIGPESKEVWLHTFHAFCARVLREDIDQVEGYKKGFSIYDTDDCKTIIKGIFKTPGTDLKPEFLPPPNEILEYMSKIKTNPKFHQEIYNLYCQAQNEYMSDIYKIYIMYQNKLKQNNALDFDDLLTLTINLFKNNEWIRYKYQSMFTHIMVDEYQDTNSVQYQLTNILAQPHHNLCVVGDADQSIYSWRGADIRNILDFKKDYPNCKVIKLEQNYRSTLPIIKAANNVITHNNAREDKTLWTKTQGEKIKYLHFKADNVESRHIVSTIKLLHEKYGYSYNDFAILYRVNSMANHFETEFISKNIPYQITGGIKLFDYKEVKDLIAYIRTTVNPYDVGALKRIINIPKRGLGPTTFEKIEKVADEQNFSIIDAITSDNLKLPPKANEGKENFVELFYEMLDHKEIDSTKDFLQFIINKTNYIEKVYEISEMKSGENKAAYMRKIEKIKEEKDRAIENFKKMLEIAANYDETANEPNIEEFLNNLALMSDDNDNLNATEPQEESDKDKKTPKVKLMTLHSAKGLEFPIVFIAGMEEGILPYSKAIDDNDQLEEERRLCYVGITRAEKMLFVTSCKNRYIYGKSIELTPSRFLKEIPEEIIQVKEFEDEY